MRAMRIGGWRAGGWATLALALTAATAGADTILVVDNNVLLRFDSATPAVFDRTVPITGLVAGDGVVGIDFRPATGQLYGLAVNGATAHLYRIDPSTGAATQVGGDIALPQSAGAALDSAFGFDFNPVVDRIRVVSIFRDNFRLNPDTGAVAGADTALSANFVAGVAYDRNLPGGAATTLYGINSSADGLVLQGGIDGMPSPNGGVITAIGPLGVDTSVLVGFDIAPPAQGGTAFAALFISASGGSQLFTIDLATGQATSIGPIGSGTLAIDALAVAPAATTGAPLASPAGLVAIGLLLAAAGAARAGRRRMRG